MACVLNRPSYTLGGRSSQTQDYVTDARRFEADASSNLLFSRPLGHPDDTGGQVRVAGCLMFFPPPPSLSWGCLTSLGSYVCVNVGGCTVLSQSGRMHDVAACVLDSFSSHWYSGGHHIRRC